MIKNYTAEAGVRNLERTVGTVCRNVAVKFYKHKKEKKSENKNFEKVIVTEEILKAALGTEAYSNDDLSDRI